MVKNIRKVLLVMICIMTTNVAISQDYVLKPNTSHPIVKQDTWNILSTDRISTLDILTALEIQGTRIFKIDIPKTDKERSYALIVDEYAKGKLVKSDTKRIGTNTYIYWEPGDTVMYRDYIEKVTVFTHQAKRDTLIMVYYQDYGRRLSLPVKCKIKEKENFYNARPFKQNALKYGAKMPMVAVASSWYDAKIQMYRFCGASILSLDESDTQDLLKMSPHYYIISYLIE